MFSSLTTLTENNFITNYNISGNAYAGFADNPQNPRSRPDFVMRKRNRHKEIYAFIYRVSSKSSGNGFPKKEMHYPMPDTLFPKKEIHHPMPDTMFPKKEIHHPTLDTLFPEKEMHHPTLDTLFPKKETEVLLSSSI